MENKITHIIREVPCDGCDFSSYFDNDFIKGYEENSIIYIVQNEGYGRFYGFNIDELKDIIRTADYLIEDFDLVRLDGVDTYKHVMEQYGIKYTPRRCHELKEWSLRANTNKLEDIADYLSITTGKTWTVDCARGYCQGDYVELLYCRDVYPNGIENYGEVYLGAAKEFCVIELDEDGNEVDWYYGFIVADCEIKDWRNCDAEYKKIVCDWDGIDEQTTRLEMIDGYSTTTTASYRIA